MNRTLDARGMACPLPVVNARKAAEEMRSGDVLTVQVDNEIAVQNLTRFASHKNYAVSIQKLAGEEFSVSMQIGDAACAAGEIEPVCAPDPRSSGMLAVLSANTMGSGDEKLGKALMKAFVFALTKQDFLPEAVLCYNSGAYLSCEGSDALEDLQALENEGVTILTCGTCLDFYGLKEKLAVGGVTNMYEIVERMERARAIIRP